MARQHIRYDNRAHPARRFDGIDPETPVPGFYRMRLRSGGMAVAVRIWFGAPIEPWTGEPMDRAPRMNATINGAWADIADVWPRCAGEPISEAEAEHLIALQRWGAEAGHESIADPRRRIDPLDSPMMF